MISAIRATDVRRRVARRDQSSTERPEQFSIDEAKQDDTHASLHWKRWEDPSRADVEGQRAYQRAF
jgi:hypothetical protein